jgi:hypothetical protein
MKWLYVFVRPWTSIVAEFVPIVVSLFSSEMIKRSFLIALRAGEKDFFIMFSRDRNGGFSFRTLDELCCHTWDAPLRFARNIGQLFRFIGGVYRRWIFAKGDYSVLSRHAICRYVWLKQNPGEN